MSAKSQLDKSEENKSNPTCSICNKQDCDSNMITCISCYNNMVHKHCCKADQWICNQCEDKRSSRSKSSKRSVRSSSSQRHFKLQQLEDWKRLQLKEIAIEREFLARKSIIMEESDDEDDCSKSTQKSNSFVEDWVDKYSTKAGHSSRAPALDANSSGPPKDVPNFLKQKWYI